MLMKFLVFDFSSIAFSSRVPFNMKVCELEQVYLSPSPTPTHTPEVWWWQSHIYNIHSFTKGEVGHREPCKSRAVLNPSLADVTSSLIKTQSFSLEMILFGSWHCPLGFCFHTVSHCPFSFLSLQRIITFPVWFLPVEVWESNSFSFLECLCAL